MSLSKQPILVFLIVTLSVVGSLASCSEWEGGRPRTIREKIDLWTFFTFGSVFFDSVAEEELRTVHLAGAGLLNHDVMVSGNVEIVGDLGTYIVISDGSARMLVDTTHTSANSNAKKAKVGNYVTVHGVIKSAENGHVYILANATRWGQAPAK